MTREEEKALLDKILSDERLTNDMKEDLRKLKETYNEQKGAEDEKGEEVKEHDVDEWERLVNERDNAYRERDEAIGKFKDIKEKYIRRIITPEKAMELHEKDYNSNDFEDIADKTKKEEIFEEEEIIK